MAKKGADYRCSSCGHRVSKWVGRCPSCGSWGTLEEAPAAASVSSGGLRTGSGAATARPITGIDPNEAKAIPTGIGELDRVLGLGVVPGSVLLLAGEPGVGKSTLLLEVAHRWAAAGNSAALYVTGEESPGQVALRAQRTGALHDNLLLVADTDISRVIEAALEQRPGLLIVDSVQTMQATGVEGTRGGVAQARAVTAALTSLAKESGIAVLVVGHVTKDGTVAGPRTMEHLVDAVLNFEGDRHSGLRFLRGIKNRFGATDEVGCFEQTTDGIREVPDPTGLFLHHRSPAPGTAITVAVDGRRPLLAEVQALVVDTQQHNPRRNVTGLDPRRVPMIAAIMQQHGGLKALADRELHVATVGGMQLNEPAADLAIAIAIASSAADKAVSAKTIALGELGLAGEVRRVPDIDRRLKEAARMGFTRAIVPQGADVPAGVQAVRVGTIAEALSATVG
ncbi:DNA repair protein RadA [Corynebacterium sp. TAE3-ERU12]|uniref:DNA repair protein RadA n=1 Tax=Corynebacterium sp. TAE3-ERU12 TaxID=2849491 RepID=UPI001C446E9A|nr:DNA repair protein RadA [Corynebacterium sp. TAE3-ERU12]MBV7295901.1 DNA repair protein RadA [Corynebacterium sp. TAE3-ERU12]